MLTIYTHKSPLRSSLLNLLTALTQPAQTLKRSNAQTLKRSNAQTLKRSNRIQYPQNRVNTMITHTQKTSLRTDNLKPILTIQADILFKRHKKALYHKDKGHFYINRFYNGF
ncbi:hypothetical protein [Acinetobacter chinensis]|jgi:hypothetical protein|uniref:hypothetical protein n=1 Tax=Acinetobacter chinensis TaxID=2004650 RepID=UPI002934C757|nr:hypothetical protein [Acinetobacter chinensis]WOE40191.1 hypothetical protein QSG87_09755 [Acinetobacter chinensis]